MPRIVGQINLEFAEKTVFAEKVVVPHTDKQAAGFQF